MRAALAVVLALAAAGCSDTSSATPAADKQQPAKEQPRMPAALAEGAPVAETVKGTVLETIDATQYTYVRLKTAEGEIWAAVAHQDLAKGAEITIGDSMWMQDFESKTLKRTFARILFGTIVTPGAAQASALPPGHPPTGASGATSVDAALAVAGQAPITDVKVEKAPGPDARTIAEVWAQKDALRGKEVVIRGRVVKWNPEIMGKNWLHLQDGSGSADKKNNDITVTTQDVVKKGDIVTVRGKVAAERDFGAGYAYAVMMEEAKVVR